MHILPSNRRKGHPLNDIHSNERILVMQVFVLVRRLMQHPATAVLGTIVCALAAKSGTVSVSLAYLGAIATFMLTRALTASIASMERFGSGHRATWRQP